MTHSSVARILAVLIPLTSLPAIASGSTCLADSAAAMQACVNALHAGTADTIEITASFECPSTPGTCSYRLHGIGSANRPIVIHGTTPTTTIHRNPAERLFRIEDSENVSIRNLRILDRAKRPHDYQDCEFQRPDTAVFVIDRDTSSGVGISDSIYLDRLIVDTGEPDIVQIGRASNVNITRSSFSGSGFFGIWTANYLPKSALRIIDNTFHNIGSNAILLSATENAWISGNDFRNNHRLNPFCLPNGQHTGGGQLLIEQGTRDVTIQSNMIEGGATTGVSGIEFADGSADAIRGIVIRHNHIHGHTGYGVVLNTATTPNGVSDVDIYDNALYANVLGQIRVDGHGDVDFHSNYYTQNLSASPRASFTGTPKTCALNGAATCTITVQWNTLLAPGIQVLVDSSGLFSTNPSGAQAAPWITANGGAFEVFSSATGPNEPIARIHLKGE